jgi:hypothetical protein
VDGLVGEQAVGVGGVGEREGQRRRVGRVVGEGVRGQARAQRGLAPRPAQPAPLQRHRARRLALQDQLPPETGLSQSSTLLYSISSYIINIPTLFHKITIPSTLYYCAYYIPSNKVIGGKN